MNNSKAYSKALKDMKLGRYSDAIAIFSKLKAENFRDSALRYGYALLNHEGDTERTLRAFMDVVDSEYGDNAAFAIAGIFWRLKRMDSAWDYYEIAANKGFWPACYRLGMIASKYAKETGLSTSNKRQEPVYYYKEAAKQGHPFSQKRVLEHRLKSEDISRIYYYVLSSVIYVRSFWIIGTCGESDPRVVS